MSSRPPKEHGVRIDRDGFVMTITINRPQVRNAIDRDTSMGIAAALDALDADPDLRVGILRGEGAHFCAGMDLKAFLRGERVELPGRGLAGMVLTPPAKPIIAAVEGYALAGGCEIALACDLIVAAEDATFGLPEVRRGLIAGSGGLIRLPQRIPRQIAMAHALTGDSMSAVQAHHWGLVNELTPPGGSWGCALALARRIASHAPLAVRLTKQMVAGSADGGDSKVWAQQAELLERVMASEDAREGSLAFAEKRAPLWRGR